MRAFAILKQDKGGGVVIIDSSISSRIYFLLLPSIFPKVNKKIKKREEADPQGQVLAKRNCRGAKRTNNKNVSEKERSAILIELKNN